MSNINYIGNANTQIKRYQDADEYLKSALEYIDDVITDLETIIGVDEASELLKNVNSKKETIELEKKKIATHIGSIRQKSRELSDAQDEENRRRAAETAAVAKAGGTS